MLSRLIRERIILLEILNRVEALGVGGADEESYYEHWARVTLGILVIPVGLQML